MGRAVPHDFGQKINGLEETPDSIEIHLDCRGLPPRVISRQRNNRHTDGAPAKHQRRSLIDACPNSELTSNGMPGQVLRNAL